MRNKRIAVISYHTCPLSEEEGSEIGGLNIYVLELSKELAKNGYIIDIYTRSENKNSPKIVNVNPHLRVIHIAGGEETKIPKNVLLKHIPTFQTNIYKFIKEAQLNYDLISSHYYLSGLIGLELKRKLNIPLVITFHTLALMKNLVAREGEKEDLQRIEAEKLLTQKADKIVATSDSDAQYINTLYNCPKEKIIILTPGVNLNLFKPLDKKVAKKKIAAELDHKLILFVGRIEPLKSIDMLFYAIKILSEKNPGLRFCLWVVGGKDIKQTAKWSRELTRLQNLRTSLNITTYVKFIGEKKQPELPFYYNAAEMVILPSQYESFGIVALEAMACGIPVITTDVTGISNLFDKKHATLVTSASNPILLADKMKVLLTDKKNYKSISQEILAKVQDLSWEKTAKRFLNSIGWE